MYLLHGLKLQIPGVEFHITNFLENNLLDLVAVLLILIPASLLGIVGANQPVLHSTYWLQRLLLALVTDLPGLLVAVLGVAVLLGLLRASLHLQLTNLLGLEMAVLLLNWEGEDVGELLAVPVHVSLANLDLDLPRNVVTSLCRFPAADHSLRSITIVLSRLVPLTIELHGICASHIVDDLFFHVAIRGLHVRTLVVVLGCHINLVGGVAHPVLASEAPLHLVCLLKGLVVNSFYQIAHQLIHIKTNPFNICFDYPSAVVEELGCTGFLILSVARPLHIRLALVLKHHLLDHVAVGVLVDTIATHVC